MKQFGLFIILFLGYHIVTAQIRLPKIFGDSMVLQRDKPITIWGWADQNEKITVQFNRQSKNTQANQQGKWKLELLPESAGGPFQLIVKGKNRVTLDNILVGDVWICSGQSNMEFQVKDVINSVAEINESKNSNIRHMMVPKDISGLPKEDIIGNNHWQSASPATTGNFTAVGYFFARELYKELHIPIGLIHTSWGGTQIETWIGKEALASSEAFVQIAGKMSETTLDSIGMIRKKALADKIQKLQGGLPIPAAIGLWKDTNYDHSHWPLMQVPKLWEQQSLVDFDGVVWFRKTITLSATEANTSATLFLGMIDDNDITYINGKKVGETNAYNEDRKYTIPSGVLHEGKNTIAVRVDDTGGGGGFYSNANEIKLMLLETSIPLSGEWAYQIASLHVTSISTGPNAYPSLLYNAMIHPLLNLGIKGALWYQGESNAGRAFQYRTAFPLMINDWRKNWAQGNFPFYFVQLAGFNSANGNSKNGSTWAELREAQTLTLSLPNTGMAVTTDIGDAKDIHPKNKQGVGKRLALVALNKTYGQTNIFSGPSFRSMKVEGNTMHIQFNNTGGGLCASKKGENIVKGFEIAGADQQFYAAHAIIKGDQIMVSAESVTMPVAVRYAWADDTGDVTLCNKEGLPAVPFRTDDWKLVTREAKYTIR